MVNFIADLPLYLLGISTIFFFFNGLFNARQDDD